jgi:hypothetical protein
MVAEQQASHLRRVWRGDRTRPGVKDTAIQATMCPLHRHWRLQMNVHSWMQAYFNFIRRDPFLQIIANKIGV